MQISINTRQAYSEIDEFIELLNEEEKNKLPQKLKEFFKEYKDSTYVKRINPQIPIVEQELKEETLAIIALLNLQYWCKDEDEKKKLKEIYARNEIEYQKKLQKETNLEEIFNKKAAKEEKQMIIYKESTIKRIFKKIIAFFKK